MVGSTNDVEEDEAALIAALDAMDEEVASTTTPATSKAIPTSGPVFDSRSRENEESIERVMASLQKDESLQELLSLGSDMASPTKSTPSSSYGAALDASKSVLQTNEQGQTVLRFFFTEIYEDAEASPGVVYLFGRIPHNGVNESVCVVIQNVSHHLFFLPAKMQSSSSLSSMEVEDASVGRYAIADVKSEVLSKLHRVVRNPSEIKFRVDRKKYAFEIEGIPTEEVCF